MERSFLDNSTTSTYLQYAVSEFDGYALYSTLSAASIIVCLVIQTPLTKISDILGLGVPFSICILFIAIAYALIAASKTMGALAAGFVLGSVGTFGLLVLGQLVMSHYTSTRARTLGIAMFYLPNIITPFVSSQLAERVLTDLTWRWGFGMFDILYPVFGLCLVAILFYLEFRKNSVQIRRREKMGFVEFISQIDLVGNVLIIAGFGLTLLPITLAGTGLATFQTPYIIAILVVGVVSLLALFGWERWGAAHPILAASFFRNTTITLIAAIGALDYFAVNVSHTYLYSWGVTARNMDISQANLLVFVQNVVQCGTMVLVGLVVFKTRQYKWIVVSGCIIRTIGYGVMIRLRGAENSIGEIFGVQVIQGVGSGIIEALLLPAVQYVVPRSELGQVTGVVQLLRFTGTAVGTTVAGAIYNNLFGSVLWKYVPAGTDKASVEAIYNSLLGELPAWGTAERTAISDAVRIVCLCSSRD
jgi:MFS family permease